MLGVPRTGFSFKPETVDCEKVPEEQSGWILLWLSLSADPRQERVVRPDTPRCFEATPGCADMTPRSCFVKHASSLNPVTV